MKIPYTSVRRGNRFFEPRGRMILAGFVPKPLGPDDEASRREAWRLYEEWMAVRDGRPPAIAMSSGKVDRATAALARRYPRGSMGQAWQAWIKTEEWAGLALSNRTKIWWPAWDRIEPVFGSADPNTITMHMVSVWLRDLRKRDGVDAAHKAMKTWRAFWRIMQALRFTQLSDPSAKVTNTAPQPRTARYNQVEALQRAKAAWRLGYRGLACIIIVCWDTGFQPGDARTARAKHLATDPTTGRHIIDRSQEGRDKTGVAVIGTLSRLGDAMVRTYLAGLGIERHEEAFLFLTRTGAPYRDTALSHDYQAVRAAVDPDDRRQMRDLRRSATTEAFRGGANAKDVAQKFGNSIDRSAFLMKTYNPVDLEQVRAADRARVRGRRGNG